MCAKFYVFCQGPYVDFVPELIRAFDLIHTKPYLRIRALLFQANGAITSHLNFFYLSYCGFI